MNIAALRAALWMGFRMQFRINDATCALCISIPRTMFSIKNKYYSIKYTQTGREGKYPDMCA